MMISFDDEDVGNDDVVMFILLIMTSFGDGIDDVMFILLH